MRRPRLRPGTNGRAARSLPVAVISLLAGHAGVALGAETLQLEVTINGAPTNLIGSFERRQRGGIAAAPAELAELGLKTPPGAVEEDLVDLDDIASGYVYDAAAQKLALTVADEGRIPKLLDLAPARPDAPAPRADVGMVLNYNLYAAGASSEWRRLGFGGASATFDARAFSDYGTLSQSAILRAIDFRASEVLRLDTTYSYSDPASLVTYRGGDVVSGGLAWTRPIRLGGLQAQRNFAIRPDLVTMPLLAASGSAAVPSTVEVYLNSLKAFSQDVPAGPFALTNVPTTTGAGTARIVVRDAGGHEVTQTLPFYASPRLLARGLTDFSLEAGYPRVGYGSSDDSYLRLPMASASVRRGVLDGVTVEGHAEAAHGLLNGGAGVTATTGTLGAVSVAAAASRHGGDTGFQLFAAYETEFAGVSLSAGTTRSFGRYRDLAALTALTPGARSASLLGGLLASAPGEASGLLLSSLPPKTLDRITASTPLPFGSGTIAASFIRLDGGDGQRSRVASLSWSRGLDRWGTVVATVFADLADRKTRGAYVSWSMPLGGATVGAGVSATPGAATPFAEAMRPLAQEPGSYGYRVRASETEGAAAGAYRSDVARSEVILGASRGGGRGSLEVEGAVAAIGGGVLFANRIDDAFAVVETGTPGILVMSENRIAGRTDGSGRALVTGLRSYDANRIAIDPRDAPVNAEVGSTQALVVPADRAGVRVAMTVRQETRSAIVVFTTADGAPVPAGATGQVGDGESFTVGYDGRAFLKDLGPENDARITLSAGECRARFAYAPSSDEQVVVGPVACR